MREAKNERYHLGEDLVIDVKTSKEEEDPMMKGPGLVIMGPEEKTEGAAEGSDEEYSHAVRDSIEFKNPENLELAQMGIELLNKAINDEQEENDE